MKIRPLTLLAFAAALTFTGCEEKKQPPTTAPDAGASKTQAAVSEDMAPGAPADAGAPEEEPAPAPELTPELLKTLMQTACAGELGETTWGGKKVPTCETCYHGGEGGAWRAEDVLLGRFTGAERDEALLILSDCEGSDAPDYQGAVTLLRAEEEEGAWRKVSLQTLDKPYACELHDGRPYCTTEDKGHLVLWAAKVLPDGAVLFRRLLAEMTQGRAFCVTEGMIGFELERITHPDLNGDGKPDVDVAARAEIARVTEENRAAAEEDGCGAYDKDLVEVTRESKHYAFDGATFEAITKKK